MADATFQLAKKPSMTEAERLAERVNAEPGVTSAIIDPNLARLYVTFDTRFTGDLTLQQLIEHEGFAIASSNETLGFLTHEPGYTDRAREQEYEQEQATRMAFEAELDLGPSHQKGG